MIESGRLAESGEVVLLPLRPTRRVRDRAAEALAGGAGSADPLGVAEPKVAGRDSCGRVHCEAGEGPNEAGSRPRDRWR